MATAGFGMPSPHLRSVGWRWSNGPACPRSPRWTPMGLRVEPGRGGWGLLPQPGSPLESDPGAGPRVCGRTPGNRKDRLKGEGIGPVTAWPQAGHCPGQQLPPTPAAPAPLPGPPGTRNQNLLVQSATWHQTIPGLLATRWQLSPLTCEMGQMQGLHQGSRRSNQVGTELHPEGARLGGSLCQSPPQTVSAGGTAVSWCQGKPRGVVFWVKLATCCKN